jgi:hypothetical protein
MIRTAHTLAFVILALIAAPLAAQQYGKVLTLKEQTKISDIIAKPDAYNGKLVQVCGTIVGVCEHRGCWIQIKRRRAISEHTVQSRGWGDFIPDGHQGQRGGG